MPEPFGTPGATDPNSDVVIGGEKLADVVARLQEQGFDKLAQTISLILQEFPEKADQFFEGRVDDWISELTTGSGRGRTEDQLRDAIFKHIVTVDDMVAKYGITPEQAQDIVLGGNDGGINYGDFLAGITGGTTPAVNEEGDPVDQPPLEEGPPPEETVDQTGTGGSTGNLTILSSPSMEWFFDPASGKWSVAYKLPGSERRVFFEATGADMDQIFGEGFRPLNYESTSFTNLSQREGYTFAGEIIEVTGTGTFEGEVERTIALALDEGILPQWARQSPEVLDLLYIAQSEGKPDEWLYDQLSQLDSFKARFPGVDQLMSDFNLTVSEGVSGFLELENGVKSVLQRSGRSVDELTPELVGELISKGQSLDDVNFVFSEFQRLESNSAALSAFNEVLAARGLDPLDEDGQLEFLAGSAPKELYDIWEAASLNQAQQEAGLNLSVSEAIDLASRTAGATSYQAAAESLNLAAQNLLKFRGDLAFDRYDIDQEDLIDLSLGLAPRSGRSQAELGRNMERAISAARAGVDGPRKQAFRSFTGEGVPQAASLSKSRTKR